MTVEIKEGEAKTIAPADNLKYPSINSCLSLTVVSSTDATRYGGHSVLIPEDAQLTLQQICDFLNQHKGKCLYIIGDIGTWNGNWNDLPQTKNLTINGVKVTNVAGIATALGYTGASQVVFDTENWGVGTYDVCFDADRKLYGKSGTTVKQVPGHTTW